MSQLPGVLNISVEGSPTDEEPDDESALRSIIQAYLDVNPTPSDKEIHALAEMLGMTPASFEAIIYKMFSAYVNDPDSYALNDVINGLTMRDQLEPDEAVQDLLVKFFVRHPEPSDEQIHHLASLIGFTPDQLEERLYSMLSDLEDIEPNPETETDLTQPFSS